MSRAAIIAILAITILTGCDNSKAGPGDSENENLPVLAISEVFANGIAGTTWVEVVNDGAVPIDLTDLRLVADSGAEVEFPEDSSPIQPQKYLAVLIEVLNAHDGVSVLDGQGRLIAYVSWPTLTSADPGPLNGQSYGITTLGTWRMMSTPTPNADNVDPVHAVLVNEVCADNDTSWENPDVPGSYDDWIEIHNPRLVDVDVGGFTLTDDFTDPAQWAIPSNTIIPAGGFLVVNADGRADELGGLHLPFKLSKSGEEIWLYAPNGILVDQFIYEQMGSDRSRGREFEGAAAWVSFRYATAMDQNHEGTLDPIDDPAHREDDPRFDQVFDESVVKRLDIEIDSTEYFRMKVDLERVLQLPPEERNFTYFECRVDFDGNSWQHVGVRWKGASSVKVPYISSQKKLPLKLKFDEFEDDYPEYLNQRFWGLKKLSLGNGFADPTLVRELACLKLMRDSGVIAPWSAPMALWVDTGDGPEYWGLYIAVEQIDEIYLEDRFANHSGNLYKPEGEGADLTHFVEESFEKKTNEDEADFTDVQNLIDVLNADYATIADQKAAVEDIVNVPSFLRWLAVNSTICNFDSYSNTDKNYYLYNDPDGGKFWFLTWDHNMAYASVIPPFDAATAHQWDILDPTDGNRPLIDRVLEVPEWNVEYRQNVLALLDGDLAEAVRTKSIEDLNELLSPHVVGPTGEVKPYTLLLSPDDFDRGLTLPVRYAGGTTIPGVLKFLSDRWAYVDAVLR